MSVGLRRDESNVKALTRVYNTTSASDMISNASREKWVGIRTHLELRELHADARTSTTVESHNTPSEDRRQVCGSDRVGKRLQPTLRPPNKSIIAPDICARIRASDMNEEIKTFRQEEGLDRVTVDTSDGLTERHNNVTFDAGSRFVSLGVR